MAQSISALIDEVLARMGWASDSAHRVRALTKFNDCEREIAQPGSFLYLSRKYSLSLANSASSIAMPAAPAVDFGKAMSLRIVGESGYLAYRPYDRFYTGAVASFYALRNTQPAIWTFARDTASAMTIFVDPANTTGGTLTLELTAQMTVADLLDSTASYSLLPEGYERTLLLGRAEAQLLGELSRPNAAQKKTDNDQQMAMFYNGQRVPKNWSMTDSESQSRKQDEAVIDTEATD